jgi:hypothetical protein
VGAEKTRRERDRSRDVLEEKRLHWKVRMISIFGKTGDG